MSPTPRLRTAGLQVSTPMLDPYGYFAVCTPSDSTTLAGVRGLYVGATGDVAVADLDGNVVTFKSVPTATFMPVSVSQVMTTNTTATQILILR